jgi:hypothetical protein
MAGLHHRHIGWISSLFLLIFTPPAGAAPPTTPAESVIATFVAADHRFERPGTLAAGQLTIRLLNRGHEPHQIQLLKLTEGKTPADLAAALQGTPFQIPRWAKHMGGPNAIGAGGESRASLYLAPAPMCSFV